jgi:hypothetical protein
MSAVDRNIPDWKSGDELLAEDLQALKNVAMRPRIRFGKGFAVGEGLTGMTVNLHDKPGKGIEVKRFKVTTASLATGVIGAKFYDGTDVAEPEIPVKSERKHAVNDDILAVKPKGGTDKEYDSDPVVWREIIYQPGDLFRVNLTQTGGANGTTSAAPTYTYTATDLNGLQLGTGLSPEFRYMFGTHAVATIGTGYFNSTGTFVHCQAFELKTTAVCP